MNKKRTSRITYFKNKYFLYNVISFTHPEIVQTEMSGEAQKYRCIAEVVASKMNLRLMIKLKAQPFFTK
ncbi:hypothetical protein ABID52_003847 [Fictibacillus halophilus]|uniref:Uncharacterized protein n=1 Tax=Fictibacillus halophilus TaxID=1610490 RepID=A0ABV2LNR3_9BACL